MKIKPLGDRMLVKPLGAAEKTAGGIYIPATAQEKTQEATVVAIGDGKDIQVKVQDKVIHDKYAGTNVKIDGEEHILLSQKTCLLLLNKQRSFCTLF